MTPTRRTQRVHTLAGCVRVRVGGRVGERAGVRAGERAGERVGVAKAQQHATAEFATRRNTIAKPSYHWNSLRVRNCHRRRILHKHNQHNQHIE